MANELVSIQDMQIMASAVARSGLFGIKTPDQAAALMLVAQAEGRHPASAAMDYDIIQGRPAMKSSAMLARFQALGGKFRWIKREDAECSAHFSHPDGGELTVSWTMERAKQAGLANKQIWKQ